MAPGRPGQVGGDYFSSAGFLQVEAKGVTAGFSHLFLLKLARGGEQERGRPPPPR